ncbi:MAG: 50S ribosomal protein L6 [Candidatus Buchananbacteria bacterium RIFCSPHIGHO2_02_FULL_40_13]|uniref:Large ribosomal subunit protein uL6 n=1 Tax=Candidatus Buchananbacteria bacterium RIFCSPLOWO2_01_FULL_39_33 TaxID=1797543 RepID=A0A1G1YL40_9BACT|nr:MAG: 50S ribosomal protein L6 [Candidatus Buchananbacteria bacterium RIFCSPHIGHO2_01_FULL_40_35]OGY50582.1 MAG: 50S ribosomal protein L6 [Candidatus Buchananbacteria bacterium RIFCSPHIGHO2_02_FULL_40_13]OGY53053.1 MAG: 50S ribosomal protein L6 [Candidatus Buchananbacteria bacterium RIFCSPLOWO2_01_FULL_39_33]
MSRIGKQQIKIPSGVEVKADDKVVIVKGPKGELKQIIHPFVTIEVNGDLAVIKVKDENNKQQRALWGLFASLLNNMIIGVTQGFSKQLEINGVGFKALAAGRKLNLNVGFSHPVEYNIPEGIEVKTEGNLITITGIDKQLVGEITAQIRKIKKPEPYKGKGLKYVGEEIKKKAGKTAGKE